MDAVTLAAAVAASKKAQTETFGAKLRRLARVAQNNNPWSRPYMKSVGPWQPSTAVAKSAMCVNGGNLYVCQTAGTTASSGGPTATNGQAITDGTAKWYYFAPNQVTQDPVTATPAWVASTAKSLGNQVVNGSSVYAVVVAGTTASSGGPTGTGNAIVDGTVTWTYMGPTWANPYANDFPVYSYSATAAPGGQTNLFAFFGSGQGGAANSFKAVAAHSVISGGSGYVVGEVLTLAGGTFTTAAKVTVTSVNAGAITEVTLTNPGSYSQLPTSNPLSQSATTGSGTGATFYQHFTQPSFCRIRGGDPVQLHVGNWCLPGVVQMSPGANEPFGTHAMEFMTDAPAVTFRLLTNSFTVDFCVIVDGVRYNITPLDAAAAASNNNFYTLTFPGRKVRRWRLERNNTGGVDLPPVYVDSNSTLWPPSDQDYIRAAFVGDSLTVGGVPGPFVTGNCVPLGVAHELGWVDPWNLGVGTTGHVHQNPGGANNHFGYRIGRMVLTAPDVWVIMGSWNDNAESTSAVTAAVTAEIATIRGSGSKAPIIYIGTWSANAGAGVLAANEAAVKAGIVDPLKNTYWVPIYGDPFAPWLLGSWNNNPTPAGANLAGATNSSLYLDTANAPHPADVGTVYEWRRMADAIRQYVLPLIP